jgi:hypothetical protein
MSGSQLLPFPYEESPQTEALLPPKSSIGQLLAALWFGFRRLNVSPSAKELEPFIAFRKTKTVAGESGSLLFGSRFADGFGDVAAQFRQCAAVLGGEGIHCIARGRLFD